MSIPELAKILGLLAAVIALAELAKKTRELLLLRLVPDVEFSDERRQKTRRIAATFSDLRCSTNHVAQVEQQLVRRSSLMLSTKIL
jgi:hypothetical protein